MASQNIGNRHDVNIYESNGSYAAEILLYENDPVAKEWYNIGYYGCYSVAVEAVRKAFGF